MSARRHWLIVAVGVLGASSFGPGTARGDAPPPELVPITATLASWLAARPHAPEDSDADVSITPEQADSFAAAVDAAAVGQWSAAQVAASSVGYEVRALVDGDAWYAVLVEADAAAGVGPTVVIAPTAARDVIVQAPHSASEPGTAVQAASAVTRLGARAVILEGAHRCASLAESDCDGISAVCGASAPFRISDVPHARSSLFEVAHERLALHWPSALVVQLHRMRPDPTRLVTSDGSGEARPGDASLPARIRDRVRVALGGEDVVAVSCHDPADDGFAYPPLCGTTNVQGRWLDGSVDACSEVGDGASGRFLHLEQGVALLDDDPPGEVVVDALVAELPCLDPTPSPGAEGCPPAPDPGAGGSGGSGSPGAGGTSGAAGSSGAGGSLAASGGQAGGPAGTTTGGAGGTATGATPPAPGGCSCRL